jgi:basic membrane protein A
VALDDWGPSVPEESQNAVSQERSAIVEGDHNVWANSTFADADDSTLFQEMNSYVDGVEGGSGTDVEPGTVWRELYAAFLSRHT